MTIVGLPQQVFPISRRAWLIRYYIHTCLVDNIARRFSSIQWAQKRCYPSSRPSGQQAIHDHMPQESQVAGVSPPPSLLGLHFYCAWPSSDYPSNTTATSSVGPWVRFPPRGEILTLSAKELQKQKKRINYYNSTKSSISQLECILIFILYSSCCWARPVHRCWLVL